MAATIMCPYFPQPPACYDYDPRAAEVARRIAGIIARLSSFVIVEHIGSTAVPGCAGKGVIDLMVLYPEGQLEAARALLDGLGFQRQTAGHLFPESRPMRVGALKHKGQIYRVHAHVIVITSPEAAALRAFRERLLADPEVMTAYVEWKRAILAAGVMDARAYTQMKSAFIQQTLAAIGDPALLPPVAY